MSDAIIKVIDHLAEKIGAAVALGIDCIGELTRWALIPEVQFYKLISGCGQSGMPRTR